MQNVNIGITALVSYLIGMISILTLVFLRHGLQIRQTIQFLSQRTKPTSPLAALWRIDKIVLETLDFDQVIQKIVENVLAELGYLKLGYAIVVLALVDQDRKTLKRISISRTKEAEKALAQSSIPFEKVEIPLSATDNYCIKTLNSQEIIVTHSWADILSPPLDKATANEIQKNIGVKTSLIVPVSSKGKSLGIMIFSLIKSEHEVSEYEKNIIVGFSDAVGIAVENALLFEQLKKITQELKEANSKLKELDLLKDEFVSVASHELRTPMTAIKSYLWMILHKKIGDDKTKFEEYLSRAYLSTERLISLVNDMLDVSRIESGRIKLNPTSFDIIKLAEDVYHELLPKALEKKQKFTVETIVLPKVIADTGKIHQVLINLAGNAIKFTPEEGSVAIKFAKDTHFVIVSVEDNGPGIKPEDKEKLFKKFSRLDNSPSSVAQNSGTGLGLFVSKQIVEILKGKIWAESEVGKGSKFKFSLPIA